MGGADLRGAPLQVSSQTPPGARVGREPPRLPGRRYNSQPCPEAPAWGSRGGSRSPGSARSPVKDTAASCRLGQAPSRQPGVPEVTAPRAAGNAPADEPAGAACAAAPDLSSPAALGRRPASHPAVTSGSGASHEVQPPEAQPPGAQPPEAPKACSSQLQAEAHADASASCSIPAAFDGQDMGSAEAHARSEHRSTPLQLPQPAVVGGEAECPGSDGKAPSNSENAQHAEAAAAGMEHSPLKAKGGAALGQVSLPRPMVRAAPAGEHAAAGLAGNIATQDEGSVGRRQEITLQTAPGDVDMGRQGSDKRTGGGPPQEQHEQPDQPQAAASGKGASEHRLVPSAMQLLGSALCPPTQVQLPAPLPRIDEELPACSPPASPAAGALQHGCQAPPQLRSPLAAGRLLLLATEVQVSPAAACPMPPASPVQALQPDLALAPAPQPSPLPAPQQQPRAPSAALSPGGGMHMQAGAGPQLHGTGGPSLGLSEAGGLPTPPVLTRVPDLVHESEGTQRALAASQIRCHYQARFVTGDAGGGVFAAVHAGDSKAMLAAAGLSAAGIPPEVCSGEAVWSVAWHALDLHRYSAIAIDLSILPGT